MMGEILGLLAKWLVNSLALFAADYLVRGIMINDFWFRACGCRAPGNS